MQPDSSYEKGPIHGAATQAEPRLWDASKTLLAARLRLLHRRIKRTLQIEESPLERYNYEGLIAILSIK